MKPVVLLGLVLLSSIKLLAQPNDMLFYYPDGKPYKRLCTSIVDINADFDKEGRIRTFSPMCWDSAKYDCFTVIGYKLFTDQPLWVFTNSDEDITKLVKSFDYQKYLGSPHFYYDLNEHVKKRTLTEGFILETLGSPNNIDIDGNDDRETKNWTYAKLGVVLIFKDGLVTGYQPIQ